MDTNTSCMCLAVRWVFRLWWLFSTQKHILSFALIMCKHQSVSIGDRAAVCKYMVYAWGFMTGLPENERSDSSPEVMSVSSAFSAQWAWLCLFSWSCWEINNEASVVPSSEAGTWDKWDLKKQFRWRRARCGLSLVRGSFLFIFRQTCCPHTSCQSLKDPPPVSRYSPLTKCHEKHHVPYFNCTRTITSKLGGLECF